jgi:hypothetical protein
VGLYMFTGGLVALCNFNDKPVEVKLRLGGRRFGARRRRLALKSGGITGSGGEVVVALGPRSTEAMWCPDTRKR